MQVLENELASRTHVANPLSYRQIVSCGIATLPDQRDLTVIFHVPWFPKLQSCECLTANSLLDGSEEDGSGGENDKLPNC